MLVQPPHYQQTVFLNHRLAGVASLHPKLGWLWLQSGQGSPHAARPASTLLYPSPAWGASFPPLANASFLFFRSKHFFGEVSRVTLLVSEQLVHSASSPISQACLCYRWDPIHLPHPKGPFFRSQQPGISCCLCHSGQRPELHFLHLTRWRQWEAGD